MKICPKQFLWFSSKIFYFVLSAIGFAMLKFVVQESFYIASAHVANARCIHDQLQFSIKDQSPQVYDELMQIAVRHNASQNLTTPALNNIFPAIHEQNDRSQEMSQVKAGFKHQHVNQSTLISKSDADTLNNTGSKMQIKQSAIFVPETTERIRRHNNGSNLLIDDVDSIVGNISSTSSQIQQQNISEDVTAINFVNIAYQPIRLTLWYDFTNFPFENTSIEYERLQQGLDRAKELIARLFSVIPIKGNLLLKRVSACGSYWQDDSSTANSQKCGRISLDYNGETCLDDFQVPDSHLGGFATYDKNGSSPNIVHYEDGEGIADTDTVLYIRAHNTRRCTERNIIAYASSCQLDQFHRPIAGYANFCPNHLASQKFDTEKFYLTRAGIYQLNEKVSLVCEKQRRVVDYVDAWQRVLTSTVMKEAAQHFNCTSFGGPLEGVVDNPIPSSHWEARFLQPSLMTSSIGLPHLTTLDRITLALFSDTGWYKVNMSLALPLAWGRGAGCEFGSVDYCRSGNNSFFCTASSLAHGCHYLHLDRGVCRSDDFLDSCKIYKAENGLGCWNRDNQRDDEMWKGETFDVNSRCFISSLSAKQNKKQVEKSRTKRSALEEEGRCYEQRCNDTTTLEIRVRGSSWVVCKSRERVEIPGYDGFIICPPTSLMCNASVSRRAKTRQGSAVCVKVKMIFVGLNRHIAGLSRNKTLIERRYTTFMEKLVEVVNKLIEGNDTMVAPRPHAAADVIRFGLKSRLSNPRSCTEAVKELKMAIFKGLVVVELEEEKFSAKQFESTYTLQPCSPLNSSQHVSSADDTKDDTASKQPPGEGVLSPGVIAAAAVGGVCVGVFAVVWFILYVKSAVPNAVGPVTGLGPEVSYEPNSRASPPSVSESGSVGQIEFHV